jgi:transposase-like protein
VRRSQAGQSNSGERFRPRGGDLRRAKAWVGFNRGRGDTENYSGEIDRAKSASHRARMADRRGRAPAKAKLDEHKTQ